MATSTQIDQHFKRRSRLSIVPLLAREFAYSPDPRNNTAPVSSGINNIKLRERRDSSSKLETLAIHFLSIARDTRQATSVIFIFPAVH